MQLNKILIIFNRYYYNTKIYGVVELISCQRWCDAETSYKFRSNSAELQVLKVNVKMNFNLKTNLYKMFG